MKKFHLILLVIIILSISFIGCQKQETNQNQEGLHYTSNDVRNRNLKEAVEYYNLEFYKASATSIENARPQKLRDEDIEIMNILATDIENKTQAIVSQLEALAEEGDLREFDRTYNQVTSNYEISSFRQTIEQAKNKYLTRVEKHNNTFLDKYYTILNNLENITTVISKDTQTDYITKTSRLKLVVVIDNFSAPVLNMDIHPSQLEPVLESLTIKGDNVKKTFEKNSYIIQDYNLSTSKIMHFELLNSNSDINLDFVTSLVSRENIVLNYKWFYEPETLSISSSNLTTLQEALQIFNNLQAEYQSVEENIYNPRFVK